jgi:hypothetical protein
MGIRIEYNVERLPDEYTTTKTVSKYVVDPDYDMKYHEAGKKVPKVRVDEVVEEKGGWLFTFMRGHQIRCTSEEQIKLLGLTAHPRLIDDSTGLEVTPQGIPVDIAEYAKNAPLADGGAPDTAASLVAARRGRRENPIEDIIRDTE